MAVIVIKEGNQDKGGNAVCPRCGERVLIDKHYGDYPQCSHCDIPYSPEPYPTTWT